MEQFGNSLKIKRKVAGCSGCGCSVGIALPLLITCIVLGFLAFAVGGFFSPRNPNGAYLPPVIPQNPLVWGTPPPYEPPTMEPTGTAFPTMLAVYPPTIAVPAPTSPPRPRDCNPQLPPTEVAGYEPTVQAILQDCARATAEAGSYQATVTAAASGYRATQTAVAVSYQATVTALAGVRHTTETAQVPTPTPPPPPDGLGPSDFPFDPYCHDFPGCAADGQGRRVITQLYGCTTFKEWPDQGWCRDNSHVGDSRWNRSQPAPAPPASDSHIYWHQAVDFDTGEGELYYSIMDGRVKATRIVTENVSDGWNRGAGTTIILESDHHEWIVQYMHMTRMGEAVWLCDGPGPHGEGYGQHLGRLWQAGDCIRHLGAGREKIVVGQSGHTGYTSKGLMCGNVYCDGNHAHIEVTHNGVDVDPMLYYGRMTGDPPPPTQVPWRGPR